jgi:hypothetical protein
MSSKELVPTPADSNGSALSQFLSRTIDYNKAGAVIPRDLLSFGLLGSIVVIATGLLALVFPGPGAVRHGGFFLVLGTQAAGLDSLMHAIAIPAILCGLALLALDLYLMRVPTSQQWRSAVVAQAAGGGLGAALSALFLALVLLNLVIWVVAIVCVAAAICLFIAGLLAGS